MKEGSVSGEDALRAELKSTKEQLEAEITSKSKVNYVIPYFRSCLAHRPLELGSAGTLPTFCSSNIFPRIYPY